MSKSINLYYRENQSMKFKKLEFFSENNKLRLTLDDLFDLDLEDSRILCLAPSLWSRSIPQSSSLDRSEQPNREMWLFHFFDLFD